MALPSRNISSYTYTNRSVGFLTQENGDYLLQENGDKLIIENPTQDPNLSARNVSSYSLPARN